MTWLTLSKNMIDFWILYMINNARKSDYAKLKIQRYIDLSLFVTEYIFSRNHENILLSILVFFLFKKFPCIYVQFNSSQFQEKSGELFPYIIYNVYIDVEKFFKINFLFFFRYQFINWLNRREMANYTRS